MLIHASANKSLIGDGEDLDIPVESLAFGAIIAIVDVVDWIKVDDGLPSDPSLQWLETHDFIEGPTCAVWNELYRLPEPVFCSGAQSLWRPSDEAMRKVFAACDKTWRRKLLVADPSVSRFEDRTAAKVVAEAKRK